MRAIGSRRRHRAAVIALALGAAAAPSAFARAAPPAWAASGPFETCLEAEAERWLNEQAERVVDQEASASGLDDSSVAAWTVAALARCAGKGAAADASSEERFGKYMAQWRQHIYDRANAIRQKGGGSD